MGVCTPLRPQNILRMSFSRISGKGLGLGAFSSRRFWRFGILLMSPVVDASRRPARPVKTFLTVGFRSSVYDF